MADEEQEQVPPEIIIQPEMMGGVWANFAVVNHSPYEFTLDFVRLDFSQKPVRGIVVSRIALSPRFIDELIQALQTNWENFAKKALPQEVYGENQSQRNTKDEASDPSSDQGHDDDASPGE